MLSVPLLAFPVYCFEAFGDGASKPDSAPIAALPIAVKMVGTVASLVNLPWPIKKSTPIIIDKMLAPKATTTILYIHISVSKRTLLYVFSGLNGVVLKCILQICICR